MNYRQYAEQIPSLGHGGITTKDIIRKYVGALKDNDVIIDIGSYLGSTTAIAAAELIEKNINAEIHCYDPWIVDENLRHKMAFHNNIKLNTGEDLLPIFSAYLEIFNQIKIHKHKQSILDAKWHGPKIALVIDDICNRKNKNDHFMKKFSHSFIENETIIIRMDYFFYETHKDVAFTYQKRFMDLNNSVFQFTERGPAESRAAIFKYIGGPINYEVEE